MLSALSACLGSEVQSPRRGASTAVPRSGASLSYSQAPVGYSYPAFKRYYEGAKTSQAHPAGFGVTSPDGTTCGPPLCLHRVARGQPRDLENFASGPRPCSYNALWRLRDLPSSQGTPVRICPALRPRPDPDAWPITTPGCCSRTVEDESSRQQLLFRGSITQLLRRLSTLRAAVAQRLRKTRFRLVANLYRTGLITRWVPMKGFRSTIIPLS